jgi:hypothetical protein
MQTKESNKNDELKPTPREEFRVIGFYHPMGIYEYMPDGTLVPFMADASNEEVVARYSFISQQIKWLMKDVLTILEATIGDDRQLNALKLLTKEKFSAKLDWIFEQMSTVEGDMAESDPATEPRYN